MKIELTLPDHFERIIAKTVEKAVQNSLPSAIRKGTRKKWLTTTEVMEILQITRRSVQNLRDTGRLPFSQNRRTIRYDINDVEAYLSRGMVNSKQ